MQLNNQIATLVVTTAVPTMPMVAGIFRGVVVEEAEAEAAALTRNTSSAR
jgi:hypothetical protein